MRYLTAAVASKDRIHERFEISVEKSLRRAYLNFVVKQIFSETNKHCHFNHKNLLLRES